MYSRNEISPDEIKRAQNNTQDFRRIYDTYFERIFSFLFRRTDDEDEAADLVSKTFLKALQGIKKYEDRGLPFSSCYTELQQMSSTDITIVEKGLPPSVLRKRCSNR